MVIANARDRKVHLPDMASVRATTVRAGGSVIELDGAHPLENDEDLVLRITTLQAFMSSLETP